MEYHFSQITKLLVAHHHCTEAYYTVGPKTFFVWNMTQLSCTETPRHTTASSRSSRYTYKIYPGTISDINKYCNIGQDTAAAVS